MTLQERSESPQFITPEWVLVQCKQVQSIHSSETGCIIETVGGDELAIVPNEWVEGEFVHGMMVARDPRNQAHVLVDLPSGQRILISEELTRAHRVSPL